MNQILQPTELNHSTKWAKWHNQMKQMNQSRNGRTPTCVGMSLSMAMSRTYGWNTVHLYCHRHHCHRHPFCHRNNLIKMINVFGIRCLRVNFGNLIFWCTTGDWPHIQKHTFCNVVAFYQRERGFWRNLPNECGGHLPRPLHLHPPRHLPLLLPHRHHLVPLRRPGLWDEVRKLDV